MIPAAPEIITNPTIQHRAGDSSVNSVAIETISNCSDCSKLLKHYTDYNTQRLAVSTDTETYLKYIVTHCDRILLSVAIGRH